ETQAQIQIQRPNPNPSPNPNPGPNLETKPKSKSKSSRPNPRLWICCTPIKIYRGPVNNKMIGRNLKQHTNQKNYFIQQVQLEYD
ncbi:unnamed protein product, partial [Adineta steineri]